MNPTKVIVEIFLWIIIASLIVLVVMNPKAAVALMTSVFNFVTGESTILTGSGYRAQRAA